MGGNDLPAIEINYGTFFLVPFLQTLMRTVMFSFVKLLKVRGGLFSF